MPQPQLRTLIAAHAGVGLLLISTALLAVARAEPLRPADVAPPGACVASGDKTAAAEVVAGQPAWVRTHLSVACTPVTAPMHVVLVQDGSEAMSGTLKNDIHVQAAAMVRGLALPANPTTRVAVVEYGDRARRLLDLSNDPVAVLQAVEKSGARGKPAIERGLTEAVAVLDAGRQAIGASAALVEAIVLLSNGRNEKGCSAAVSAADEAKKQRILLLASCVSAGCELDCLRQVATAPRYAYGAADEEQAALLEALRRGRRQTAVSVVDLSVRDRLRLAYVPGSGNPAPDYVSADRKTLHWRASGLPSTGITISFEVGTGPDDIGEQAVSAWAEAAFTNSLGWSGVFTFPVPQIRVVAPPPTAVSTASPTASHEWPTATVTTVPTAEPTSAEPARGRVFLPWLGREIASQPAQGAEAGGVAPGAHRRSR